jgi:hypothetical protein
MYILLSFVRNSWKAFSAVSDNLEHAARERFFRGVQASFGGCHEQSIEIFTAKPARSYLRHRQWHYCN